MTERDERVPGRALVGYPSRIPDEGGAYDLATIVEVHGPAGEIVRVTSPWDDGTDRYILIGFRAWDHEADVDGELQDEQYVQLDFGSGVRVATAILSALLPGATWLDGQP